MDKVPVPHEVVMKAKEHFEKAIPILEEQLLRERSLRKRARTEEKIKTYKQGLLEISEYEKEASEGVPQEDRKERS